MVVAGYVDAQGWLVSLDRSGKERWQKFFGSYGGTQVRALARLDADLLALGSRAEKFGEWWSAKSPGDGGSDASSDDVVQTKLEIAGSDVNQMLRAVVDLGDAGLVALGTAKKNHIQAHDQVVVVGFDRSGTMTWSKVFVDVRVTEVFGGRMVGETASFVVEVPSATNVTATSLGLLEVSADGATTAARQIADTEGWRAAGFVEGADSAIVLGYVQSDAGMRWRRLALP